MPRPYSRGIQDANFAPASLTLPAAASTTVTTTGFDFGTNTTFPESIEFRIVVPALSAVIVPDTKTVTVTVETSTTSNFAAIDEVLFTQTLTGAGGVGVAALDRRVKPPSNCAEFVRLKIAFGALTTDGSALAATFYVYF